MPEDSDKVSSRISCRAVAFVSFARSFLLSSIAVSFVKVSYVRVSSGYPLVR